MHEYGDAGQVVKPSGRIIDNLVFIIMEFVQGGLLFDLCQTMGAMGEDAGRFFLNQLLDSLEYMHNKRVVHRDLKLENILIDDQLNLKVADFGFACYKSIDTLKSYRGTMTYMAPEIKEGKQYKGTEVDVFSIGVILFIIVQGIFPFKEARKEEYFYNLLLSGKIDTYFQKVNGNNLSAEFKDLILKFFAYDGANRPTIEQIRNHPWMTNASYNHDATRQ
jgi:serine/threonine protein kinase